MAFPSSPTVGQEYTQDGRTWEWDGVAWEVVALPGPQGPAGTPGVASATAPLALSSGVLSIDLSAYLTSSTAASTYQPLSGMSSYLTTSAAASTYQTLSGMSSYLTTSSAASTYQTISGMSSYLTTSAAATTYYPLTGNPSGFLTSAPVTSVAGRTGAITLANTDISGLGTMATATAADYSTTSAANLLYYPLSSNPAGYLTSAPVTSVAGRTGAITLAVADISGAAPLASPSLTGTPLSTTAAADTNTTQIATTAFVIGQASATSPVMDGTATVGTSLKYARQDHVHPTDTSRAALNSPTFTGTPTLPTGTIATTQTAGNNTTAVATTAFVQAAIPAAATHTQAVQFASSTTYAKVIDSASQRIAPSVLRIWPSPSNYNGSATSGTGATSSLTLIGCNISAPNVGTAGSASYYHGNGIGDVAYLLWGGSQNNSIDFSKRVSMSFRFSQYPSNVNSSTRVVLGKIHGTAVGDLTSKGIGVKYTQVGAGYWFYLQVHNGTTLTNVQSSTQYAGGVADLEVVSDGAGNATLYLNGASVATTTGAPTTTTAVNATVFAEIDSTVSATAKCVANIGRLYVNSLNF